MAPEMTLACAGEARTADGTARLLRLPNSFYEDYFRIWSALVRARETLAFG